jgi:hypothetical protein
MREEKIPTLQDLKESYVPVWEQNVLISVDGTIPSRDHFYSQFNDIHNPLSTPMIQRTIKESGALHTSMSIGDIVIIGHKLHMCSSEGWLSVDL